MRRQHGFTIVEAVVLLVVLVIIGAVGYSAYTNFIAPQTQTASTATVASSSSSPAPVKVETKADLDNAATALNNVSLDDSDTSQLNNATNSF